jgi:hypothetical protein
MGVVALEHLEDLKELGIVAAPQPLRQIVQDPALDSYILSFEVRSVDPKLSNEGTGRSDL